MDIDKTQIGDMSNIVKDLEILAENLDEATGEKEFSWVNSKFDQYMGYYKNIDQLGSVIDIKAMWTVGKGFKASEEVKKILGKIRGYGKDSFNTIMENAVRVYNIGGDFFAQIITENDEELKEDGSNLINLKPLNPKFVKIVVDQNGLIKRYDYGMGNGKEVKIKPEKMFHLAFNRIASEIHGMSICERLEKVILKEREAFEDLSIVFHRYVKPLWLWKLDTDDPVKIANFQAKADKTVKSGENIFIPKDAVEAERISVPQYSTLDPLPWINTLNNRIYQSANVPDVVMGSAKQTTEASAKILYLAFQQSIEKNQLFLEEQIKLQLNLELNFEFPASIEADLIKDNKKDGKVNIDKKETQVNVEGKV